MGVFGVRGFKFDDGCIKRDYDFKLKIFHHCIFVSEIQKKFCKALIGAPFKF